MMDNKSLIISIIIMSVVTASLRAIPFLVFNDSNKTPKFVAVLGKILPYSIIGMLVVYCLKDISFYNLSSWAPTIISLAVVGILHAWKRNTLLSILCGTLCNMVLIQYVFL